ncbi:glycoside hydrolase [Yarrowia lipolytica]|nr:glycoside hydrolase [Yarrowia lipolytica]KAE8175228.1 glycoside hydrolase [Yarrowia lipolytica]RDW32167.1 glycoside hydrolase [Yarrowia lipolytica]RDW43105.1 glycoside hydrolase [Yarrowia lipolytica]RDW49846.1 glycoside hydrolase [Yarrowia lipolytica]
MYFSRKGLDRFTQILVVLNDVVGDKACARDLLGRLKNAFTVFVNHRQQNPLAYNTLWKGIVSTAGLGTDSPADFDYANPSPQGKSFPIHRSFYWWSGHSWAKGLHLSADGKDEESSSKDYHSVYAIKLWGNANGNQAMEARANLQLAIMKRAMNTYILVPGISFEHKADHATYFGMNPEYIIGIHALPTTPVSAYIRDPAFVRDMGSAAG